MKHGILFVSFLFIVIFASAQDVIVKKDGSTILSKVLEVGETKIKYKKFNNQQGPIYIISVSDIFSINYESGDVDTFEPSNNAKNDEKMEAKEVEVPAPMSSEIIEKNKSIIEEINNRTVNYIGKAKGKKAGTRVCTLGVSPTSVMEDNNIKVSFEMGREITFCYVTWSGKYVPKQTTYKPINNFSTDINTKVRFCLVPHIENKTDRTIYLDLANCFLILDNEAEAYYVPTATQVTNSSSSGASVNVGAITGALGVGGVVGTLANGVNVGGGSTSTTSNITYSQRVLIIPPKSKLELDGKFIGCGERFVKNDWEYSNIYYKYLPPEFFVLNKKNKKELKTIIVGEKIDIPEEKMHYPLGMSYSYSFTEDISNSQSVRIDLGVKHILGGGTLLSCPKEKDLELINDPLFFWW